MWGVEGWELALEERSPETSPGWVKSEAWLKMGVQRVTGVESLRIKESKDTASKRGQKKWSFPED